MMTRHRKWVFRDYPGIRACIVKQGDHRWATCEKLEYEVFTDPDTGFCEPNEEGRIPDFDGFGRQEFVAAVAGDKVVGVLRMMYSDEAVMRQGLFQTYDHRRELGIPPDMERHLDSLDPRRVVDFASISVAREARRTRAFQAIITRTLRRIWETDRRYGLSCTDTPLLEKYKARGLHFRDIGPSTFYWGSLTTAAIIDSFSVPQGRDRWIIPLCRIRGFLERTFEFLS